MCIQCIFASGSADPVVNIKNAKKDFVCKFDDKKLAEIKKVKNGLKANAIIGANLTYDKVFKGLDMCSKGDIDIT